MELEDLYEDEDGRTDPGEPTDMSTQKLIQLAGLLHEAGYSQCFEGDATALRALNEAEDIIHLEIQARRRDESVFVCSRCEDEGRLFIDDCVVPCPECNL